MRWYLTNFLVVFTSMTTSLGSMLKISSGLVVDGAGAGVWAVPVVAGAGVWDVPVVAGAGVWDVPVVAGAGVWTVPVVAGAGV